MSEFKTGEGKTGVPSSAFRANYDTIDWTNTEKPVEARPDPLQEALGALKEMLWTSLGVDHDAFLAAEERARKVLADHGIEV